MEGTEAKILFSCIVLHSMNMQAYGKVVNQSAPIFILITLITSVKVGIISVQIVSCFTDC